ncbi:hypothetical protein ACRE_072070 [Hapsidospora chrysogenum ATCC 11550]|uniref:HNH nuclease domain-containing protein n=1 Tax=Hapsidospora chrysogenum (strain ATCC 11550 / CBS 779.69 / DSM 880 / IAM 14645 / JCM 23072 / IMI 49137) TaxID=857340 RepID=A0A086SY81_HAPC1|nr:hypothetical protein ACRE_072070 [Hapsidospora chrysogenum ATCC 11550]
MAAPNQLPDEVHRHYQDCVQGFFESNPVLAHVENGLAYHTARPVINPPPTLTDDETAALEADVEERLRLARTIVEIMKTDVENLEPPREMMDFRLNMMHVAYVMFADMDTLRNLSVMKGMRGGEVFHCFNNCEILLASFLQRGGSQARRRSRVPSLASPTRPASKDEDDKDQTFQPAGKSNSVGRSQSEVEKVGIGTHTRRDGFACVVTGTPDPDACHVWPFKSTSDRKGKDELRHTIHSQVFLFSNEIRQNLIDLLAPLNQELAVSDKAWNMICLNPQLHRWWGKAYFGLRWIGEVEGDGAYSSFKVEWRWLPGKIHDRLDSEFLSHQKGDKNAVRMFPKLDTEDSLQAVKRVTFDAMKSVHRAAGPPKPGAKVYDQSGRTVESGYVLTLKIEKEDLDRVKTVIEAQWKLLQVAALSGAGEAPDELDSTYRPAPELLPVFTPHQEAHDTGAEEEPAEGASTSD